MKLKQQLISLLIVFLLCFTGCSKLPVPTNANTAFENFTHCFFQQEVSSNTVNLHYSLQNPEKHGIVDAPITLGSFDFDETAAMAAIENWEVALHKFSYRSLSEENRLTYDILSHYLTTLKNDVNYYLYDEPLSPVTGIHAQLPVLLAEYQFLDKEDVETYLALLETLPNYFASLTRFEKRKSEAGLFMADCLADEVIEQCHAFISMGEENYLLSTFEERIKHVEGLAEAQCLDYIQQNRDIVFACVIPAYETLAMSTASLKGTEKEPKGLCSLSEGYDYYTHLVAMETGSGRTIQELHSLIQKQIAADLLDCQQIMNNNPSILEDVDMITEAPDKILKTLKNKINDAFPDTASVNVEVKYVPHALEEFLSPAFYLIPAIDNFAENTIYINQSYSLTNIELFTTLAHEGYPGHLYQTTYFANTNPDPIRTLLSCSGYVEGWATYAEMCSYYISSLEKPYATLLQKNNSLILGLYAATDIGIHYDGWTLKDTIDFFSNYGIRNEATIEEIYNYIVGDPANYLTYYVGYLEILELKKDVIEEEGDNFSQKAFHKRVLEIGPAPFEIIRKYY